MIKVDKRDKLAGLLGVPTHDICYSYAGTYVAMDDKEYYVLSKMDAYDMALTLVIDNLYLADPQYLADLTDLQACVYATLQELPDYIANRAILAIINGTIGSEGLLDDMIASDGVESILAKHDGKEINLGGDCYAYRVA